MNIPVVEVTPVKAVSSCDDSYDKIEETFLNGEKQIIESNINRSCTTANVWRINLQERPIRLVHECVGKDYKTRVSRYTDDPDYTYISIFNERKSFEDMFADADILNDLAIEQGLNYVFTVGE